MIVKRPSVSMKMEIFRTLAWASLITGSSRCAWIASAIVEKFERDRLVAVPEDWTPPKLRGGPTVTAEQRRERDGEYFSGTMTL